MRIVLASLAGALLAVAQPVPALAKDWIKLLGGATATFPVAADGLAVEPVRIPFVTAVGGIDPSLLEVEVVSAKLDATASRAGGFTAAIVAPEEGDTLHALEIKPADGRTLPAGRYDLTVIAWARKAVPPAGTPPLGGTRQAGQTSTPPTGAAAGAIGTDQACAACQSLDLALTRDAATLSLEEPTIIVHSPSWDWLPTSQPPVEAVLREEAGLSGAAVGVEPAIVRAKGDASPPERTLPTALENDTVAPGGTGRVTVLDAATLGLGAWTATLRVRSDQAKPAVLVKRITIVRSLAPWLLIAAVAAGVLSGHLVRSVLVDAIGRSRANADAERLAERLRAQAGEIRDAEFDEARQTALRRLEAAIVDPAQTPDTLTALVKEAEAGVRTALESFESRRKAQLEAVNLRLGAVEEVVELVPPLGSAFAPLLASLRERRSLVDESFVSEAAARAGEFRIEVRRHRRALIGWADGVTEGVDQLQDAWPELFGISASMQAAAAKIKEGALALVGEDVRAADDEKSLNILVRASEIGEQLAVALSIFWLPNACGLLDGLRDKVANAAVKDRIDAARIALERAVEASTGKGSVDPSLPKAAREAAALMQEPGTSVADALVQDQFVADAAAGKGPTAAQTSPWLIDGPGSVRAGDWNRWRLVPAGSRIDAPPARWSIDGRIAAVGRSWLFHSFDRAGSATLTARFDADGWEKKLDLIVTIVPAPARTTARQWVSLAVWAQRGQAVLVGSLITVIGYFVLEASFALPKDLFAGFMWGFTSDITVNGVVALRSQIVRQ